VPLPRLLPYDLLPLARNTLLKAFARSATHFHHVEELVSFFVLFDFFYSAIFLQNIFMGCIDIADMIE